MKKLIYLLAVLFLGTVTSCGNSSGDAENDELESKQLKGYEILDLSPWGFFMEVKVPNSEAHGTAKVTLTESGALKIVVGPSFGLEIMYGEGDIALLKMDLEEDLVFTHTIIKEEEDALIYSQDIPDAGVKTQNHFFYKVQIANETYEIRELLEGEYSKPMIAKMLLAAKTVKAVDPTAILKSN